MKNMRIKKDLRTQLRVKLLPRFMGPLKVLELIGPKAVRVQLPEGTKIHDVFHVSLVEPFLKPDGTTHLHEVPQPLDWLDGLPTYEIDKLLAHGTRNCWKTQNLGIPGTMERLPSRVMVYPYFSFPSTQP